MRKDIKTPKPVEKVELDIKNVKLRFIIVILLVCIVIGSGIFALVSVLTKSNGWTEIQMHSSDISAIGDDYYFEYELGNGKMNATAENKLVTDTYTESLTKLYKELDTYNSYEGMNNLYTINQNPNQEIVISESLYTNLKSILALDKTYLYYGPISSYYEQFVLLNYDTQNADIDPNQSSEIQTYFLSIISYINKGEIHLDLLGNNIVKLYVSEEYKSFMMDAEYPWIDFGFLREAYILEGVGQALIEADLTHGFITSFSGYYMDLYKNRDYAINLYDLEEQVATRQARLVTVKNTKGVQFRSFPAFGLNDLNMYFSYPDGHHTSRYFSMKDGLNHSCMSALTAFSSSLSLPEIAWEGYLVFISDDFFKSTKVDMAWIEGDTIHYTGDSIGEVLFESISVTKQVKES